eukprot:2307795-Pyramimonas_sp.AAC.1
MRVVRKVGYEMKQLKKDMGSEFENMNARASTLEAATSDIEDIEIRMTNWENMFSNKMEHITNDFQNMGVQQTPRSTSGASNTSATEYHYYGKRA